MEANERLLWIKSTFLIIIYLSLVSSNLPLDVSTKENIACYGNYHNFVKLECMNPQVIVNVTKVLLGAKPAGKNCPMTTNTDNYKEECCRPEIDDCMIPASSQVAIRCIGQNVCEIQTIWALLTDVCQPKIYPRFTNFMSVHYQCGTPKEKSSAATTAAQKSSTIKSTNQPKMPVDKTESTTILHFTTLLERTSSSVETSPSSAAYFVNKPKSSMTGIIIGISCGFLGMLLSALGVWIYCSRKNQASTKPTSQELPPPSHFLENILSYSKTRKSFCKGYNNFSNLMPSTNPVLTQRDGQHAQILRSPSDASDVSNQSPHSNTPSSLATVFNSVSSSQSPPPLSSDRTHSHGITILNNFASV